MAKALKFKKREIDETKTKEQREYEATREMADFYRQNPHRFISTELGCETLTWFQDLIIYLAFKSSVFFYIACRGAGKSYILAWIIVVMGILYPRTNIIIASSTKGQARLIITQKIMGEIWNRYPRVRREIKEKEVSVAVNNTYIPFKNGSMAKVVVSNDNARGERCSVLVLDEDAKIKPHIRKNVLQKFLQNGERIPRYKDNPKYINFKPLEEKKKQFRITSGEFQTNPIYKECLDSFKSMIENSKINQILLSMHWGFPAAEPSINLTYENDIKPELESSTFNKLFWSMENEGVFVSESEFSMFGYQELRNLQTLKTTLVSFPNYLYTNKKELEEWKKKHYIEKKPEELRVLAIDVAVMGGEKNDNTVYSVISAVPEKNRYKRSLMYMEHASDAHSEAQSIRMKQLYYDFEIDVICLDVNGVGMGIADGASKPQHDNERGIDYPAFITFNKETMNNRMYNADIYSANPCIFAIKQTSEFNHYLITYLRSSIENYRLELPLEYYEALEYYEEEFEKKPEMLTSISDYLKTNIETDFLIKELAALEIKRQPNNVYLKAVEGSGRKDRFSSLAFGNYWIQTQEDELGNEDDSDSNDMDFYFEL